MTAMLRSAYSKGMRQKILIAAALMHNPDLVCWMNRSPASMSAPASFSAASFRSWRARQGHAVQLARTRYRGAYLHSSHHSSSRQVVADDSIERLRSLMELPTLEGIFSQLAVEQDTDTMARQLADLIHA